MTAYAFLEQLGAGELAEVFRGVATSDDGFEMPVALKRIRPELAKDRRLVDMLVAQARLFAGVRQRNIVPILDMGRTQDGLCVQVMEYVDGVDLGTLAAGAEAACVPFPPLVAAHLAAEACEALDHVHRATDPKRRPLGLVHGNLAPGNVLVSRTGEVKLTGFLCARTVEEREIVSRLVPRFAYASPEQAAGGRIDGRSDVYSLGVVLYELLLGRQATHGDEPTRRGRAGRLPPPSAIDPSIPLGLDRVVVRALAREPSQRWPSAADFGRALRELRAEASTLTIDPAHELASLVTRYGPLETDGRRVNPGEDRPRLAVRLDSLVSALDDALGVRDLGLAGATTPAPEDQVRFVETTSSDTTGREISIDPLVGTLAQPVPEAQFVNRPPRPPADALARSLGASPSDFDIHLESDATRLMDRSGDGRPGHAPANRRAGAPGSVEVARYAANSGTWAPGPALPPSAMPGSQPPLALPYAKPPSVSSVSSLPPVPPGSSLPPVPPGSWLPPVPHGVTLPPLAPGAWPPAIWPSLRRREAARRFGAAIRGFRFSPKLAAVGLLLLAVLVVLLVSGMLVPDRAAPDVHPLAPPVPYGEPRATGNDPAAGLRP